MVDTMKMTDKKRLIANGATTKKSSRSGRTKSKITTACTKKVLTGNNGKSAVALYWLVQRRWRLAARYATTRDKHQQDREQLIRLDVTPDSGQSRNLDFFTYDTAPKVNRLKTVVKLVLRWCSGLPGGFERLVCMLMAIFLFLGMVSVQMYVGMLGKYHIRSRIALCPRPSTLTELITFECHLLLLFLAWICSILIAWLIMGCHFLYWSFTHIWSHTDRSSELVQHGLQNLAHRDSCKKQLHSIVTDSNTVVVTHTGLEEKKDN